SDSTQDAQEEGRSKQQLHHRKNDIYVEIAKAIFSAGNESVKIHCPCSGQPRYICWSDSKVCSLKQKYRKYIALLGQTGASWTYDDLVSNTSTKNIIGTVTSKIDSMFAHFGLFVELIRNKDK
ncbi:hypothetical protein BKA82DRAFT_135274, partial [Pisolithus tinctorius]